MPRRIESLFLNGPAGRLEAILEEPEEVSPIEAALVCHPHPKGGGTMHNKVVHRTARGLRKAGCAVLRFNYRGVNLSDGTFDHGIGETEDARIALKELHGRYPNLPVLCAGFSFGSRIALRLASQENVIGRAIAIGFPTTVKERAFTYEVRVPKYFVHSTNDEYGPREEFSDFYQSLPEPKHLDWVEAADHFFRDRLDEFEGVIERIGRTR
ncbi:MAG: alpha/beta family hydrolase [Bryobacteraceae bacterium]